MISIEEKKKKLLEVGWYPWYSEDNWIPPNTERPDYAGIPLNIAYERVFEKPLINKRIYKDIYGNIKVENAEK